MCSLFKRLKNMVQKEQARLTVQAQSSEDVHAQRKKQAKETLYIDRF